MKKKYTLLLFFMLGWQIINAQVFDVATIQSSGDPNKFINLVIMGDGYTDTEQDAFLDTASNISNYLFSISPWSQYKNYFNVYAIKVISPESGVKHANTASDCSGYFTAISNPTNYFGTRYDGYGIHRLTIVTNTTRITNVLAANFPNYDQVFIVGNSPEYGGSGGAYAVFSANAASNEIAAHEIGHSFAGLADEYYAGDQYFAEKINMTQQSDPLLIKWKNWVGTNGIGIQNYCCGGNSNLWFKPTSNSCKMEQLNLPYCSVCKEGIIEKIHSLVNPIVSYTPVTVRLSVFGNL
ncbi:M64 family metallopeptidase [Flavobacterium sp.]|uniref:M64 family metallopeptidase n=1 Tax=Flavobacterium sp. TaxID=239 RepID=UPI00286A23FB|nr:M64 family metallopeptidase [Flavobacterium sp.]